MAPIAEVTEEDVDVFYPSGVKGTLWAMQAVYPHMQTQQWGRIVNFASSMGITGGRGFAAYNASKEAIRALDAHRRASGRADGIVVNAIAPAAATHHGEAGKQSEGYRLFIENCPMGRQGDPELDIGRSPGSSAPTPAATSPATRSWPTAARSCGRDRDVARCRGTARPRAFGSSKRSNPAPTTSTVRAI